MQVLHSNNVCLLIANPLQDCRMKTTYLEYKVGIGKLWFHLIKT